MATVFSGSTFTHAGLTEPGTKYVAVKKKTNPRKHSLHTLAPTWCIFHHSSPYALLVAAVRMQDPLELRTSCCSSSVVNWCQLNLESEWIQDVHLLAFEFYSSLSSLSFFQHLFISSFCFLWPKQLRQFTWISSLPSIFFLQVIHENWVLRTQQCLGSRFGPPRFNSKVSPGLGTNDGARW